MLTIALTGGIGSGKSAASAYFEKLGTDVIDADLISRELVEPGQEALLEISQQFGSKILQKNGQLNRSKLRQIIFDSPEQRSLLESILHPRIREIMSQRITNAKSSYVILVIPLLLETGQAHIYDRVLLIDTTEEQQRQRVMQRDNSTEKELDQIFASQSTREQRQNKADDIILNSGDLEQLHQAVFEQHKRYLTLAKNNNF